MDAFGILEELSDEELGQWTRAIFRYKIDGTIPDFPRGSLLAGTFKFVKAQLDRDAEAWEDERGRRSEAGRKGGLAKARILIFALWL